MQVFFAIDLPDPIKSTIGELLLQLKKPLKYNNIRWVKPQNLHLTLQFLEKVEAEQLPPLLDAVRQTTDRIAAFPLEFGKIDIFLAANQSRIIFLEAGPTSHLKEIANALRESIKLAGHPTEIRPFRAHITLGRIKNNAVKNIALPAIELPLFEKIRVEAITLFEALCLPEGPQYQALQRFALK